MKDRQNRARVRLGTSLLCLGLLTQDFAAFARDSATLFSVSAPAGTPVMPKTIFTQTWTMQNTGTKTWTPGQHGYTLNMVGKDTLGAITLFTNAYSSWYIPSAIINEGNSI